MQSSKEPRPCRASPSPPSPSSSLAGATAAARGPALTGTTGSSTGAPNSSTFSAPDPFNLVTGRGSVSYDYRLSRTEVTTQQWLDFFNTFSTAADAPAPLISPILWGARDTTFFWPGTCYRLSATSTNAGAVFPVAGVDRRIRQALQLVMQ